MAIAMIVRGTRDTLTVQTDVGIHPLRPDPRTGFPNRRESSQGTKPISRKIRKNWRSLSVFSMIPPIREGEYPDWDPGPPIIDLPDIPKEPTGGHRAVLGTRVTTRLSRYLEGAVGDGDAIS